MNSTKSVYAIFSIVLILWMTSIPPGFATAQDLSIADRFRNEGLPKWQEYLRFARSLQMSVSTEETGSVNGKPHHVTRKMVVKQSGVLSLTSTQESDGTTQRGSVTAKNSQYGFRLNRNSSTSGWLLKELIAPAGIPDTWVKYPQRGKLPVTAWGYRLDPLLWLPDVVSTNEFIVSGVKSVGSPAGIRARVEFRYQPNDRDNNAARVGWMDLDPERYWLMCDYETRLISEQPGGNTLRAHFEYRPDHLNRPIVDRITLSAKTDPGVSPSEDLEIVHECSATEQSSVPESEFTLSAFGLPEPNGVKWNTGTPWYVWLFAAAGVTLLAAFVLRRLARRSRSVATSAP